MRWSEVWRTALLPGALAGLVGGLLLGAAMSEIGMLPAIAQIVRAQAALVGFIVVMVLAAVLGAGFGALVWYQRPGAGETLFWGLVYGSFCWYLGPLTLLPLLRGKGLAWDVDSAQAAFPVYLGLVLYGGATGLVLVFLRWLRSRPAGTLHYSGGALLRGVLAGVLAASTPLPVLGVPINSGALQGLDALLATVQMPSGLPVGTLAIDGSKNAALLAVQIPFVEVHLSNIFAREAERRHSLLADIAVGVVAGFGGLGYLLAFDALIAHLKSRER